MRRLAALAVIALALIMAHPFAPGVGTQGPAFYTIEDLGAISGRSVTPRAINNAGVVVGYYPTNGEGGYGAFRYDTGPNPVPLPAGEVTPIEATAINDAGVIVGTATDMAGRSVAFRYSDAGGAVGLGFLDPAYDPSSFAYGVNTAGEAAGYSGVLSSRAAKFVAPGLVVDLGELPGGWGGWAYAINDAGTVTGCATDANGQQRAVVWSPSAPPQDLGTLGGSTSCGLAVNAAGQIAGWAQTAGGQPNAFLYTPGAATPMTALGLPAGFVSSQALDVNDVGAVVGYLMDAGWNQHALLHTAQDGVVDLNSRIDPALGWRLDVAVGINNAGQIVGIGYVNGGFRGFRLTPPDPPVEPQETEPDPPDTTPPVIGKVRASPNVLWPPFGQMVRVRLRVSVTDDVDPEPACRIVEVASNQQDTRRRFVKQPDFQVTGDLTVKLRAELLPPKHRERTYTVTVACADEAGNAATAATRVTVVRLPPWFWCRWR